MGELTRRIESKEDNLSHDKFKVVTDYIHQCGFDEKQARIDVGKFSLAARNILNCLMYLVQILENEQN